MTQIIPITNLRKNIFTLVDKITKTGDEIEIEKAGKRVAKLVPIHDDPVSKAKYALTFILPRLSGVFKNIPPKDWKDWQKFRRGKKEKLYWKRNIFHDKSLSRY